MAKRWYVVIKKDGTHEAVKGKKQKIAKFYGVKPKKIRKIKHKDLILTEFLATVVNKTIKALDIQF